MQWLEYRVSLCSGCGSPRVESFDPVNERRYEAHVLKCHACAARDGKARVVRDNNDSNVSGLYFAATLKPDDDD